MAHGSEPPDAGRDAFAARCAALGLRVPEDQLAPLAANVAALAEKVALVRASRDARIEPACVFVADGAVAGAAEPRIGAEKPP
jgi:hypothetical protein